MTDIGTNIVTVEWDEENINKGGNKVQISGVAVITLKFGKATHAKDYIFATDEEQRKAWGELQPRLIANRRNESQLFKAHISYRFLKYISYYVDRGIPCIHQT
jgi:hypothetical protein